MPASVKEREAALTAFLEREFWRSSGLRLRPAPHAGPRAGGSDGRGVSAHVPSGATSFGPRRAARERRYDCGLDRMRGPGAMHNLAFQVGTGNLSAPVDKWKPEMFFDVAPLEAVLQELGRQ